LLGQDKFLVKISLVQSLTFIKVDDAGETDSVFSESCMTK